MKTLRISLCLILSQSYPIFSQWYQQNSGTTNRFLTCFFLDENTGWAAGNLGTIVKTTDGGQNWFSQSISTSDNIHSIFFTDSSNGWIALYEFVPDRHGVIMHTTNGGETWVTQLTEWWGTLHRVFFTDINNGYAFGSSGLLYKTTNGGQYWSDISPFYDYWLYSAFFFNPNVGWIGGGLEGYFIRTTNGGLSWSWLGLPTNERMMCIYFTDETNGWACGAGGKILRTTNSGLDWLLGNSGINVELRDIKFINQNEGWSVGLSGKILHTSNGGASWNEQNSGTNFNLFGVHFSNGLTGWAVGDNGIILKTNNGGVPVELLSFYGEVEAGKIVLKWETATEINNSGFEIERRNESNGFIKVGFVPGFGTTTEYKSYSFFDESIQFGTYTYRLKQIDFDGTFKYLNEVSVDFTTLSDYFLDQNYPNPFNPATTIKYSIAHDGLVILQVFDVLGNEVKSLVNSYQNSGNYEVVFDGSYFSSGIYYYQLKSGEFIAVKKLVIMK